MGKIRDELTVGYEFAQRDKVDHTGTAARVAAQELATHWDSVLHHSDPIDPDRIVSDVARVQDILKEWGQMVVQALKESSRCNACGQSWPTFQVRKLNLEELYRQVGPGDIMPVGACPDMACKGLCFLKPT